ncbi:MAG TPA: hypothetical protein VEX86_18300, partial [Longimicrobium sp.]|nr:hypothetical protein [Longimicrobium sp.]
IDPESDVLDRLAQRFTGDKITLHVEGMKRDGDDVEVTFGLSAPPPEHDALVKHLVRDQDVRRFTRN